MLAYVRTSWRASRQKKHANCGHDTVWLAPLLGDQSGSIASPSQLFVCIGVQF